MVSSNAASFTPKHEGSKYAKIKIKHGEPTRLALVLMCVFCAEESTRNQVPQTQPHQAL